MKSLLILIAGLYILNHSVAQDSDSLQTHKLKEIIITGQREGNSVDRLPDIQKTFLWSGKKNEVINLQNLDANIAEKTARQIFAKVPGIFVYDMDGSGNQVNISARGLDPHRGWEFNIRKNGIITNSDMYGYPASHYNMPMEAVDKIEMVRGTGSLQYGAQFGGMLNYVSKQPDSTRKIGFESINSAGSFGLLSTYNAISGTIGKFQYYTYFSKRVSDGYRANSQSDYDAQSVTLIYNVSKNLKITGEISRSNYIYQIPGPLTDSMFHANPGQSTRARNYFNPEIYVPSIVLDWKLGSRTNFLWTTSAVIGNRNSVQFDKPANVSDAIDPATLTYAPRQVDIDHFNSYTTEMRFLHTCQIFKRKNIVVAGLQIMNNDLNRQQLGKGTSGTDFDLTRTQPGWGRDLHFKTKNLAFFAENSFTLFPKLSINTGLRFEMGQSDMFGIITYYDADNIPNSIKHRFPLLGINAQYKIKENQTLYAGWSQAYRPVIFKDIIPASLYETVNKNLKDAYGYNVEAGFRGDLSSFRWDVGLFRLKYNNRLGTQASRDENGIFYLYRTNIGNSITDGAELFLEYGHLLSREIGFTIFTSTSFMKSKYENAFVRSGNETINVNGNNVESVPNVISRNGFTIKLSSASVTILYSYTGETFADPLNTVKPSANGSVGLVPSYGLLDINSSFRLSDNLKVRLNINNATDKNYFTKRPSFYPGPGVWPSDGRSFVFTAEIKI